MKVIVGLGNPGARYEGTRHNLGFMVVDSLAGKCGAKVTGKAHRALVGKGTIAGSQVVLAKPQTFMNLSGESVSGILRELRADPEDLVVIHDDLDLPLGGMRVKKSGGDGGHRGVASVMAELGTGSFIRVRLGVGRPGPGKDPAEYVLDPFLTDEADTVSELVKSAVEAVLAILREGPDRAMNRFNKNIV